MAAQVSEQEQQQDVEAALEAPLEMDNNSKNSAEVNGTTDQVDVDDAQDAQDLLNGLRISEDGEENNGVERDDMDGLHTAKSKEDDYDGPNGKGNEEKKIFCGGISYDTNSEDLNVHFSQFGPVKEAQVKYDRLTGRSRGFAFVEFVTVEGCKASLVQREQTIKGKQCEIKPAKTRELGYMNKKIFVGGLPGDFPEEELRTHFEQFGAVDDVEWPFDKVSKTRKNFAFVVFVSEESADKAAANPKQQFADRECDIKKAVPQNRRPGGGGGFMFPRGGGGGGGGANQLGSLRGAYGGGGGPAMLSGGGGGLNGGGGGGMRNGGGLGAGAHQQMPMYQQQSAAAAWYQMNATAAWYNAAYNGGPWYPSGAGTSAANASAAAAHQWYNSAGNNPAAAAAQAQWYGQWYNNNNSTNGGAVGGNAAANGTVGGGGAVDLNNGTM